MLREESQDRQRQGFGLRSTCVHTEDGYFWKVSSSFYFKDWISRVSYISIFKYKGRSASLPQINSNYLRIVRYIDLSTSLTLSTNTISKKYMCAMLASDRGFSEAKQIYVCVHTYAGWSHGRNHTCLQNVDIAKEASMCIAHIHDGLMTVITRVCSHTYRIFTWLESYMCFSIDKTVLRQKQQACVYTCVGYSLDKDLMFVFTHTWELE